MYTVKYYIKYGKREKENRNLYMDPKKASVVFSQAEIALTSNFKKCFYLSSIWVYLLVISVI